MTFSELSHSGKSSRPDRRLDLRFESPGQLAIAALLLWLAGAIIHPLSVLVPVGIVLLAVAALAYLLRPKTTTMYWRGRRIELDERRGTGQHLYSLLFRR